MSAYLSDRLHLFLTETEGLKETPEVSASFGEFIREMRDTLGSLQGREIYAFERSALNAAADLRIDKPDRLDRLAAAVLEEPRQIFVEASGADKGIIGRGLRGFLDPRAKGNDALGDIEGYGDRWGAFIDVLGGGRARFRTVHTRPKSWLSRNPRTEHIQREISLHPKPWRAPLERAFSFDVSPHWTRLDIHTHVGTSRSEFDMAVARLGNGADPIVDRAREAESEAQGPRAAGQARDAAWRLARFRDLLRPDEEALPAGSLARSLSVLTRDHAALALEDGITIVAMLAVLQADSSDIRSTPRPARGRRDTKGRKKALKAERRAQAPGLSVVTLNLEDRGLQRLYDGGVSAASDASTSGSDGGHGRVRHPVRGHLFLARNNQMVWRRPHWRGQLEEPKIRRVVAPSHKD